ncbi:hypothetical protein ABE26_23035 [Cytobacillus firmus]|jgi:hypothetical protein|nr:hypothetical protein [Cytobacillus firmus]
MVKLERKGEVYYMHEPSKTIVSKLCIGCKVIRLIEDYDKTGTGKGIAGTRIYCKQCEGGQA